MSVRFKFRSSVDLDSVDIDGRPSISAADLRARIIHQKNLTLCKGFDLVISDADTGKVYEDADAPIPEGSSVIVRRVPVEKSAPSDQPGDRGRLFDPLVSSPSGKVDVDDFEDLGAYLCPGLEGFLPKSDAEPGTKLIASDKADTIVERYPDAFSPKKWSTDLPAELRCSLCNKIFNEAVMIPCCQHSFCDRCIHLELVEKERCPKCSSTKFRVKDLLPNLSLRQAIEHFLEAQMPLSGSDKIMTKYVPDGESGIQAKEVSCAISIRQREPILPHSPSATGKGSNLVVTESAGESLARNKGEVAGTTSRIIHLNTGRSMKSSSALLKMKQIKENDEKNAIDCPGYIDSSQQRLKQMADDEGHGKHSKLPQNLLRSEEGNVVNRKKKGLHANTSDGTGNSVVGNKYKKGERNCYMCGSPDHLVRDCPAASLSNAMLQRDAAFHGGVSTFGPSYWPGGSYPPMRSYANIYGTPGMMSFDPRMVPVTPYGVPSYMPSMYGGLPVPWMGSLASPVVSRGEFHPTSIELAGHHHKEYQHNTHSGNLDREHSLDGLAQDYYHDEPRRSRDYNPQSNKQPAKSSSREEYHRQHKKHSLDRRSYSSSHQRSNFTSDYEDIHSVQREHEKSSHLSGSGRDHRGYYSEKSDMEAEEMSDDSDYQTRERNKHHHRRSKKHNSDCGKKTHHRCQKDILDDRKRVDTEAKKHRRKRNCHSDSDSGSEPNMANERKRHRREKKDSHKSRHPMQKVNTQDDRLISNRWEMFDGFDKDDEEEYHYHKCKESFN